jgi:hypothetical protein
MNHDDRRIGPRPGDPILPTLTATDIRNWEPDPATLSRALGLKGKDADGRTTAGRGTRSPD